MMTPNHPSQPAGFVLLLTLILLAMAAVILLEISRVSVRQALQARQAEETLQQQWAARSCQNVLLHRSLQVLMASEATTAGPRPIATTSLKLGYFDFELHFTDEQAKVNLNRVLLQQSSEAVAKTVRDLLGDQTLSAQAALGVQVRPLLRSSAMPEVTPSAFGYSPARSLTAAPTRTGTPRDFGAHAGLARLGSWGQIFADDIARDANRLAPSPGGETEPLEDFTLWGNGRLNFHRATPDALLATCRGILNSSDVARILDLRRQYPGISLDQLMRELDCSAEQQAILPNLLTGSSSTYGMWMIVRKEADQRITFARFLVHDRFAHPVPRTLTLEW